VFANAAAPWKTYRTSREFLTEPATETLIWLCWSTALIAEHVFLPLTAALPGCKYGPRRTDVPAAAIDTSLDSTAQTKRPPGNAGSLFFKGE
jgi:hypothetical protein